jgi:hypothetical protein
LPPSRLERLRRPQRASRGLVEVSNQPVDPAAVTAFTFGMSAVLFAVLLVITIVLVGCVTISNWSARLYRCGAEARPSRHGLWVHIGSSVISSCPAQAAGVVDALKASRKGERSPILFAYDSSDNTRGRPAEPRLGGRDLRMGVDALQRPCRTARGPASVAGAGA